MIRSASRVLVLAALLVALAAPAATAASGRHLQSQRPQETGWSWVGAALAKLGDLLSRKEGEIRQAVAPTGSCIDPQGQPVTCGS